MADWGSNFTSGAATAVRALEAQRAHERALMQMKMNKDQQEWSNKMAERKQTMQEEELAFNQGLGLRKQEQSENMANDASALAWRKQEEAEEAADDASALAWRKQEHAEQATEDAAAWQKEKDVALYDLSSRAQGIRERQAEWDDALNEQKYEKFKLENEKLDMLMGDEEKRRDMQKQSGLHDYAFLANRLHMKLDGEIDEKTGTVKGGYSFLAGEELEKVKSFFESDMLKRASQVAYAVGDNGMPIMRITYDDGSTSTVSPLELKAAAEAVGGGKDFGARWGSTEWYRASNPDYVLKQQANYNAAKRNALFEHKIMTDSSDRRYGIDMKANGGSGGLGNIAGGGGKVAKIENRNGRYAVSYGGRTVYAKTPSELDKILGDARSAGYSIQ